MDSTKARLLIAEDESIVAMDIKMHLNKIGYEVLRTVLTGEEAIAAAGELKPDMVLMDISLKGDMLGTEAAEIIHNSFGTPVIFLTAYADADTLEKAKKSEPFGYITKPFEDTDLRVVIEVALSKAKAEAERRELTAKLQKALDEVKILSGLIPICAACKKVRDDQGFWQAVEEYIEKRSVAQFTHGICPECINELYTDGNDSNTQ